MLIMSCDSEKEATKRPIMTFLFALRFGEGLE